MLHRQKKNGQYHTDSKQTEFNVSEWQQTVLCAVNSSVFIFFVL